MAATGPKKKQKMKGKTLNLNEFLADDAEQAQAFKKPVSWADEVEEADEDVGDFNSYGAPTRRVNRAVLPTAPKAARGPDIDLNSIPSNPPFTAFLGNLPYDIDERDIEDFFKGLSVSNIRLPTGQGRLKGFGYAEFEDRQSLIDALSLNEGQIRNRQIRIDLAEHNQQGGESKSDWRRRDDGQPEVNRSDAEDWRRGPDRGPPGGPDRDGYGGDRDRYNDRGGDRYGDRNDRYGGGGGFDRYGDRSDRYGDRNDRYGDRNDRYGDRNDRYGDRNDRYGDRNDRYGGSRYGDRGDRYGDRGGDRFGDRGDRYGDRRYNDRDGDRYGDRDGRRSFGSGFRSDDREDRFSSRDIRYTRDGRRDERYIRDGDRPYGVRDEKSDTDREAPRDRPRLQLQPRSKPVDAKPEPPKEAERSSSIFGGAKPVDTAAREREIEERLKKQQEVDHQKVEMEKESREYERKQRLSSSDDRRRSDSGGDGPRRELMPPPHTGSGRPRRESDRDHEEVFDEDKATSPKATPPRKEEVKMVDAPAPKENVWQRRKPAPGGPPTAKADAGPTSPTRTSEQPPVSPTTSPASPTPKENAWSRGKPSIVPAEPPKDNAWTKRKQESEHSEDDRSRVDGRQSGGRKPESGGAPPNAWGRGGSGAAIVSGRGRGHSDGPNRGRPGKDREKPLPTSIDEMPKYEGNKAKDWSDSNKFSHLMAEDENNEAED